MKLEGYIYYTVLAHILVHIFWYWTQKSTILLWIRLRFLYLISYSFVSRRLMTSHRSQLDRFFTACLVIHSAVLFLGLDFRDYSPSIAKRVFFCSWCVHMAVVNFLLSFSVSANIINRFFSFRLFFICKFDLTTLHRNKKFTHYFF